MVPVEYYEVELELEADFDSRIHPVHTYSPLSSLGLVFRHF